MFDDNVYHTFNELFYHFTMIFVEIWKFGIPEMESQMERQCSGFKKNLGNPMGHKGLYLYSNMFLHKIKKPSN